MSSSFGNGSNRRKRVSGVLSQSGRGLNILTDSGYLWVLDQVDVNPDLLGHQVTVEGVQEGYDRLSVEWIGSS